MKIALAEFDAFQKQLPEGVFFDGDDNFVKDEFYDGKYDPTELVNVDKGDIYLCWEGKGDYPLKSEDFVTEFKMWKTSFNFEFVNIKIPKGKKNEVMQMIKERFGDLE